MFMFAVNVFTTFVLSNERPTFVNPHLQLQVFFRPCSFINPPPPTWPPISYIPFFHPPPPPLSLREGKAHSSFLSCHICANEPERGIFILSRTPPRRLVFISRKTTYEKSQCWSDGERTFRGLTSLEHFYIIFCKLFFAILKHFRSPFFNFSSYIFSWIDINIWATALLPLP